MAARKATSRPRTARSGKGSKKKTTAAARKRAASPARTRRPAAKRTKASTRRPLRRATVTKRPAPGRKVTAARKGNKGKKTRKTVAARPKSPAVGTKSRKKTSTATRARAAVAAPRKGTKKATLASHAPKARAAATPARTNAPRASTRPAQTPIRSAPPPALARERRQLGDLERDDVVAVTGGDDRLMASVLSGREELRELLGQHHETSPELTAGDVDAKWTDAYAVGDEAPGGDNPTPDQDRVDDIGKALGVNYEDNEELRGSDKIIERDKHRWELDPASSDDWPHD